MGASACSSDTMAREDTTPRRRYTKPCVGPRLARHRPVPGLDVLRTRHKNMLLATRREYEQPFLRGVSRGEKRESFFGLSNGESENTKYSCFLGAASVESENMRISGLADFQFPEWSLGMFK